MRIRARTALIASLLALAGCASQAPDLAGPANERVFPSPFHLVWEAAQRAVPDVWGQNVRSADEENGVLIFNSRLLAAHAESRPGARVTDPERTLAQTITQELTVFVARGGEDATRVSLKLETGSSNGSADEPSPSDERLERKILDAIGRELKK